MSGNTVLSGGRCEFYLNGAPMGYAVGVTVTENVSQEPVRVLNNLRPMEFATVAYDVTLRTQLYRLPNSDLVAAGLWPQAGATQEAHKRLFYSFEPMTADILDTHTGAFVAHLFGVVPQSRTIQFTQRGLIMTDASWLALGMRDEGSSV